MAKRVNITEKLSFDENPVLVIRDKELEVNTDATTVLKIMGLHKAGVEDSEAVIKMYELLFSEKDRKKIEEMKLSFGDLQIVIEEAMNLVDGEEDQGEQ